jgi:hypothetical protein
VWYGLIKKGIWFENFSKYNWILADKKLSLQMSDGANYFYNLPHYTLHTMCGVLRSFQKSIN